jgi:hypothetical protein
MEERKLDIDINDSVFKRYYVDLIVLIHGIQGPFADSAEDLKFIKEQLQEKFLHKDHMCIVD